MSSTCPFTLRECDGGVIHADNSVGCGYKVDPRSECSWEHDVPKHVSPRDFYNAALMEAMRA